MADEITPCYCRAASYREDVAEGMAAKRKDSHRVGVPGENQVVAWKNQYYILYNEEISCFDGIYDAAIYLSHNLGRACTEVDVIDRLGYLVPTQHPGPTPSTPSGRTCMLSLKVDPRRLAGIWEQGGEEHGGVRLDPQAERRDLRPIPKQSWGRRNE